MILQRRRRRKKILGSEVPKNAPNPDFGPFLLNAQNSSATIFNRTKKLRNALEYFLNFRQDAQKSVVIIFLREAFLLQTVDIFPKMGVLVAIFITSVTIRFLTFS